MQHRTLSLALLLALLVLPITDARSKEPDKPLDELQSEVIAVLARLESNPVNKEGAAQKLRTALYRIIDKHGGKLRPGTGSKKFVSADGTFVLVIAASGGNGRKGEKAEASDKKAKLV